MSEHPTIRLMYEAAEAFTSGDLPRLLEAWHPDIEWIVPGHNAVSGTYRGREELSRFFMTVQEKTGGTAQVRMDKVLADGEYSCHFLTFTGERDGATTTLTVAGFGKQDPSDGRPYRVWFLPNDLPAMDRLVA
jgi:hypothetical protein